MKFLIHLHTGPQDSTKATLGPLVAVTALRETHHVDVFSAGDAVHLLAPAHAGLEGLGTGRLADHLPGLAEGGARLHLPGRSATARGSDDARRAGRSAAPARPEVLVRLAAEADKVLTYQG